MSPIFFVRLLLRAGNNYWLTPAPLKWTHDPAAGPLMTMGWLYGAALVGRTLPLDSEGLQK